MPTVIDEFVISLGYKLDKKSTEELAKAAKAARASAGEVATAYEKAGKKVEEAQKAIKTATTKEAKAVAKAQLDAAKDSEKVWKKWAKETEDSAKKAEKAFLDAYKSEEKASERAANEAIKQQKKVAAEREKLANQRRSAVGGAAKSAGMAVTGGILGAAVAAPAGLLAFVEQSTAALDVVQKQSEAAGLTAREYQRMGFAAERSGVSIENVAKASREIGKRLLDVQTKGTGPFKEGMDALGLSTQDFIGIPFEDRLGVIADSLSRVEDESTRLSLAQKFLGEEAGPQLANLLAQGSDGIRALGDEAESLGLVLSQDAVDSAAKFQDELTNLKSALAGVSAEVASEMVPVLKEGIEETTRWIKENRELIKQKLAEFFQQAAEFGRTFVPVLRQVAEVAGVVGRAISTLIDYLGPGGFLTAVSGARLAISTLGTSFSAAAGPIGILTAAAMGAVQALQLLDRIERDRDERKDKDKARREFAARQTDESREVDRLSRLASDQDDYGNAKTAEIIRQGARKDLQAFIASASDASLVDISARVGDPLGQQLIRDELQSRARGGSISAGQAAGSIAAGLKKVSPEEAEKQRALADAMAQLEQSGFLKDIQALGARSKATDKAQQKAIDAAAARIAEGAGLQQGFDAAAGVLTSMTGVDFKAPKDELSAYFGIDSLPDEPLNKLTQEVHPQILTLTINNSFDVTINQDISGAGDPVAVGDRVADRTKRIWQEDLVAVSKLSKVVFAR